MHFVSLFKLHRMIIFSYVTIREFGQLHNDAADALNIWFKIMKQADVRNLSELKEIFNSVDYVGNDRYVFNIRENNYRLIAMIHFSIRTVYILFIGTHSEYDKINASTIKYK